MLIFETVIRFACPLAFQRRIPNYSTAKTREDMAKRKRKIKMMARLFFIFWILSNIFRDFSGCFRGSILIFKMVITFVCPLAFQCRISNCFRLSVFFSSYLRKFLQYNNLEYGIGKLMDRQI